MERKRDYNLKSLHAHYCLLYSSVLYMVLERREFHYILGPKGKIVLQMESTKNAITQRCVCWIFPGRTIGKPGKTDRKASGKLAFNAVWQQCYEAVFSFVNKTGVAKALCCPDITQIHKTAYCDSKCRSLNLCRHPGVIL